MNDDQNWLICTAVLCVLMLALFVGGLVRRKKPFDLNLIVPLLLGCAGSVAAVKMIVLAFTLPLQVAGTPVASNVDSASIFVGGVVFFLTAIYGSIRIVIEAYQPEQSDDEGNLDAE